MPIDLIAESEKAARQRGFIAPQGMSEGRFEGAEERKDPSWSRSIGAAFSNENTISTIKRRFQQNRAAEIGPRIDAKAVIAGNAEYRDRLSHLPEEFRERAEGARTEEELEFIINSAEERVRNAETLQNAGLLQNLGSQLAAGLVDPVDIAVSAATGGLGKLAKIGKTSHRVLAGATAAGVANAAVEGVISTEDPTRDGTDVAAAFGSGMLLGGLFSVPGAARASRADRRLNTAMSDGVTKALGKKPSVSRAARPAPTGPGQAVAAIKELFPGVKVTSNYRGPNHPLSKKNPDSWHARSHAAVDVKPIKGMTFEQFKGRLRAAGYDLIEAINEVGAGRTKHATGDHWHVVLGTGGERPVDTPLGVPEINDANLPSPDELYDQAIAGAEDRIDLAGDTHPHLLIDNRPAPKPTDASSARTSDPDVEYFGTSLLMPGSYGKLLDSSVPVKRRNLASQLIAATSRTDGETRAITAEETAAHLERSWRASNYLAYNPHFKEWAKERGIGLLRQDLTSRPQQEFMDEVTRAMLGAADVSPQAKAAANAFADSYEKALRHAKEARIEGFDDVEFNRSYVPRHISARKFMELHRAIGADGVRAILRQSMVARGMPEELANRVAKAYEEGSLKRILDGGADRPQGLSEDSIERLRYYLPDSDPELVDDVIAHLKTFRQEANKDAGRMKHARSRIDMDLLSKVNINGVDYTALDLFETDASVLFDRYTKSLSGWIGLSERAGIRSEADWNARIQEVMEEGKYDPKLKTHLKRLDEIKSLILGRPVNREDGVARRATQALMKLNFATSMGQAGMASIAEVGNIIGHLGLRNAMMHIPALRSIWKSARAGEWDADFTDELRGLFGAGMRTKLSRGRAGYDDYVDDIELKLFDTIDRVLDPMARAVGYVGLIGPVNDYLQLLATKAFLQKLARVATGHGSFSKADRARLRDAGFEDGVLNRALESIRKHGKFDGKRLVGLNADKWDQHILADLKDVTDRMVYRAVQENDIGSSAWWMHSTLGRLVTQFRSFILNAYVKQTLHALRFRDLQTLTALTLTTTFGGMSWMARTYLNTTSNEEKRVEMLTPERLATAAMSATGYSSILPTVVDTGLMQAGSDPLFQHVRTTGLSTNAISGIPTVSSVNNIVDTATLPVRVGRDDYSFSQDDLRKITRLLPFNNVFGVRNLLDLMAEDLPKKSKEDDYWQ